MECYEEQHKKYEDRMKRKTIEDKCIHNNKDYIFTKDNTIEGLTELSNPTSTEYRCKLCGYKFWRRDKIK